MTASRSPRSRSHRRPPPGVGRTPHEPHTWRANSGIDSYLQVRQAPAAGAAPTARDLSFVPADPGGHRGLTNRFSQNTITPPPDSPDTAPAATHVSHRSRRVPCSSPKASRRVPDLGRAATLPLSRSRGSLGAPQRDHGGFCSARDAAVSSSPKARFGRGSNQERGDRTCRGWCQLRVAGHRVARGGSGAALSRLFTTPPRVLDQAPDSVVEA